MIPEFMNNVLKSIYFFIQGYKDRNRVANLDSGALKRADLFRPYGRYSIPKNIWIYWHNGEHNAPLIVQRCIQSWRSQNPTWNVTVLNRSTASSLINMEDFPQDIDLPERFFANLLRIRLLNCHGGVWVDSTVLCHRSLDDWLPINLTAGFFAFRYPSGDRWIETWFLASTPKHEIIEAWEIEYRQYLHSIRSLPKEYFGCYYAFQWALIRNKPMYDIWRVSPSLPAAPCLMMSSAVKEYISIEQFRQILEHGLPLSKLNWRFEDSTVEDFLESINTPG